MTSFRVLRLLTVLLVPWLTQCASMKKEKRKVGLREDAEATAVMESADPVPAKADKPGAADMVEADGTTEDFDDLDEYDVVVISDPFERVNRGTFWLNDKLYAFLCRPVAKAYETVLPSRLRKGIYNAYENVKFPVRLVNATLSGEFKRAGLHTQKFAVNTVAGVGGLVRVSDKIPVLAEVPEDDTGKTFAKWGMGHGPYLVIPFFGPSSLRDGVGLLGDYAMNPVNYGIYWWGKYDWTAIPPTVNTIRMMPPLLTTYDETTRDAIDPYVAVRSAYVQFRDEMVKK